MSRDFDALAVGVKLYPLLVLFWGLNIRQRKPAFRLHCLRATYHPHCAVTGQCWSYLVRLT